MRRELEEEVFVDAPYTPRCVGLINDDQSDVGRVHLGVVHLVDLQRPEVRPRETEIIQSGFRAVEEILGRPVGLRDLVADLHGSPFRPGQVRGPLSGLVDMRTMHRNISVIQLFTPLAAVCLLASPAGQVIGAPQAAGTVESCNFPTKSLPPPFRSPKQFAEGYKLFQAGGAHLPERLTVEGVIVMGNAQIGLNAKETEGLRGELGSSIQQYFLGRPFQECQFCSAILPGR